jgi:hypothetical protein
MDKPPDVSDHKWLTREKQIIWSILDQLPDHGYFSMVFDEKSFDNWLPFIGNNFGRRCAIRLSWIASMLKHWTNNLARNLKRNLREAEEEIVLSREVDSATFYHCAATTYAKAKIENALFQGIVFPTR